MICAFIVSPDTLVSELQLQKGKSGVWLESPVSQAGGRTCVCVSLEFDFCLAGLWKPGAVRNEEEEV